MFWCAYMAARRDIFREESHVTPQRKYAAAIANNAIPAPHSHHVGSLRVSRVAVLLSTLVLHKNHTCRARGIHAQELGTVHEQVW